MESSACKIVGHVEYNGDALVQLGFKCLPRRTHPSGTPNSGSQLFLAISLSLSSRGSLVVASRFVAGRHIITEASRVLSRFLVAAFFSPPTQLRLRPFLLAARSSFRCSCSFHRSRAPFLSIPRLYPRSLLLAHFGPV